MVKKKVFLSLGTLALADMISLGIAPSKEQLITEKEAIISHDEAEVAIDRMGSCRNGWLPIYVCLIIDTFFRKVLA